MLRLSLALAVSLMLAGCGAEGPRVVRAAPPPSRIVPPTVGLDRVMGQDTATLVALFGQPALDIREGPARKLQFRGPACTLDAYLYPPQGGGPAPKVTWIDARGPQGQDFDRASCIAALVRR
jgi:hypothetical protein